MYPISLNGIADLLIDLLKTILFKRAIENIYYKKKKLLYNNFTFPQHTAETPIMASGTALMTPE